MDHTGRGSLTDPPPRNRVCEGPNPDEGVPCHLTPMSGWRWMRNQMNWNSSDRRFRLPDDWEQRRAMVKARAHGRCEARIHAKDCDGIGTDCDHIVPGDNHSLDNLQWLSYACHKAKTARESAERNRRYKKLRSHPNERHPGLIGR